MKADRQTVRKLFGELVVHKGYTDRKSVEKALKIQQEDEKAGRPRRMLGLIMVAEGIIDNFQFIDLLKDIDHIVHDDEV
jgi:hypothetical protein